MNSWLTYEAEIRATFPSIREVQIGPDHILL